MNEMITTSEQHRAIKQELNLRQWSAIIQDRQNSGMSIKSYCEQHGLTEGSYYYWQKVVRKKACSTLSEFKEDPVFVPVTCGSNFNAFAIQKDSSNLSCITLEIQDIKISLTGSVDMPSFQMSLRRSVHIVETAKANRQDPYPYPYPYLYLYFVHLFNELPGQDFKHHPEILDALMPWNEDVQKICKMGNLRISADIYKDGLFKEYPMI